MRDPVATSSDRLLFKADLLPQIIWVLIFPLIDPQMESFVG